MKILWGKSWGTLGAVPLGPPGVSFPPLVLCPIPRRQLPGPAGHQLRTGHQSEPLQPLVLQQSLLPLLQASPLLAGVVAPETCVPHPGALVGHPPCRRRRDTEHTRQEGTFDAVGLSLPWGRASRAHGPLLRWRHPAAGSHTFTPRILCLCPH